MEMGFLMIVNSNLKLGMEESLSFTVELILMAISTKSMGSCWSILKKISILKKNREDSGMNLAYDRTGTTKLG